MNQTDTTKLLVRELSRHGLPLTLSEVHKYVAAVWPSALVDPIVACWADRMVRAGLASALLSSTLPRRAKVWD
jgi:hypothetical protein